jgi:hypothetical protein
VRRTRTFPILVAALLMGGFILLPSLARAQDHHHGGARGAVVIAGGWYQPYWGWGAGFWGPGYWGPGYWGGWYPWGYPYYPVTSNSADLRVLATPKNAKVYVDGYYAGIVDDFDGFFQHLTLAPGGHEVTLYLEGYRTITRRVYLDPHNTFKLRATMQPLPPGQTSEPPPAPVGPPPNAQGPAGRGGYGPYEPRGPRAAPPEPPLPGEPPMAGEPPAPAPPAVAAPREPSSTFGALSIRVQPADAAVLIDGERWDGSSGRARLVIQVSGGVHHVEITRDGYRAYEADIEVQPGETRTINISLTKEG